MSLDPLLGAIPSAARTVPRDPAAALDLLLRGSGYRAVRVGPASFRVERSPHPTPRRPKPAAVAGSAGEGEPIVVQGKFPTLLRAYPGSLVRVLPGGTGKSGADPAGLEGIARHTPVLATTGFGEGRDKLFIRGIADSSFNGAGQPTTAIYFDDAPIGFGSPNANLRLYDVAAVEILEGPQGTLYGGGSIGGVIRITPRAVELGKWGGSLATEGSVTAEGAPGGTLSGMVNVPLVADRAGLRAVGYAERQGGVIDGGPLGRNIDTVTVRGGRAALAVRLPGGWSADLGGFYQETRAANAPYADSTGPLARSATIDEPYGSSLALGRLAVRKHWDSGIELASVFSVGGRTSQDRFDASMSPAMPLAYDLERTSTVVANESRLSRTASSGLSWVVGVALQRVTDGQSRARGDPDGTVALDEVTNITTSGSAFFQARLPLLARLSATVGLRYTTAQTNSRPARGGQASFIQGPIAHRADPTVALFWEASDSVALFSRFQTGYRNGGVTVARGVGRVADFDPDSIVMAEAGLRYRPPGTGLTASTTVSTSWWSNIQAELITPRGTPITTNVGDARITTVEGQLAWRRAVGLELGAAFLWTANRLLGPLPTESQPRDRLLPDVPRFSGALRAGYSVRRATGSWGGEAVLRYVGRSVLGPGTLFDLAQGDYTVVDLGVRRSVNRFDFHAAIDNLLDDRSNIFAFGNPLLVAQRDNRVPLRPRTLRVGLGVTL